VNSRNSSGRHDSFLTVLFACASEATATWRFTNFVLYCINIEEVCFIQFTKSYCLYMLIYLITDMLSACRAPSTYPCCCCCCCYSVTNGNASDDVTRRNRSVTGSRRTAERVGEFIAGTRDSAECRLFRMRQKATRTRAGVTTSYAVLSSQLFGARKTVYKRRARPLATASCTTTIQVSAGRAELTWQLPRSAALAVLLPDGWTPRPVFINRTVRPSVRLYMR